MRQGLVYRLSCETCKEGEKKVSYVGETSRTAYDRGLEWLTSLRRGDSSNPLEAHALEEHPNAPREFKMEILKMAESPLIRQITEAMLITEYGESSTILNSKGEWGQNLPPRLAIDGDGHFRPPHPQISTNNNDFYSIRLAEKETRRAGDQGGSREGSPGDGGHDGAMEGRPPPRPMEGVLPPPP